MVVKIKKLRDGACTPTFAHNDDENAGIDLYACIDGKPITLMPGDIMTIGTGIAVEVVEYQFLPRRAERFLQKLFGWKPAVLIRTRSGIAKQGVVVSEGTVDGGYRGEVGVTIKNATKKCFTIDHGMRIAQGVVVKLPDVKVIEVPYLSDATRGDRGFGSSGA